VTSEHIFVGGSEPTADPQPDWTHQALPIPGHVKGGGTMFCLVAKTGKILWRMPHGCPPDRSRGFDHYPITSQPAVDGERVCYLTTDWKLVCLDTQGFIDDQNDGPFLAETTVGKMDGDVVWQIDLEAELGVRPRTPGDVGYVQSSPLIVGGKVYVVTGNGSNDGYLRKGEKVRVYAPLLHPSSAWSYPPEW
jgi:outer membrane protein assembly factor BamB